MRLTAWSRWQVAAGPWRHWVSCHVLVVPDLYGVTPRRIARLFAAETLAIDLTQELSHRHDTAVLLDLEPILGIQLAARLSASGVAHVVPVLPRWPYSEAILPTAELLACVIAESERLTTRQLDESNVVFVLDAERSKPIHRPERDRRADNRYQVSLTDLPNLALLRAAGIRRVLKLGYP